jgi:hypothetical protein
MAADQQAPSPATRAAVTFVGSLVMLGAEGLAYLVRMTGKAETFLDESIGFLREVRPLVVSLGNAVDAGLIEDIRRVIGVTETTLAQLGLASATLDSATAQLATVLPTLDKSAQGMLKMLPVIETLPATQADIRAAREALQQVQTLVTSTIGGLDVIPGAKLVKGISGGVVDNLTGRAVSARKPQPDDNALF